MRKSKIFERDISPNGDTLNLIRNLVYFLIANVTPMRKLIIFERDISLMVALWTVCSLFYTIRMMKTK
jgi:hypothetical protein